MVFPRRVTDTAFTWLFRAFSFTGVAALGAIVVFILFQGAFPFLFPTSGVLRLVIERINHITINGQVYENPRGFIELPWDTDTVTVQFINRDGSPNPEERELIFRLAPEKNRTRVRPDGRRRILPIVHVPKGRTTLLHPIEAGDGAVTFPDAYTCSVSFPGTIASLSEKIHIILPEPSYNIFSFLSGKNWLPTDEKVYGILPMILGSIFVCIGALLLGVPVAILCALFMSEFLPAKLASLIRVGVELLAGIPSVVYGFFGLMVIVPFIKNTFGTPAGNSLLAGVIVLAVMILPTIIAVSEKCLKAVPRSRREASLAVGASKMQTAIHVVLPHARSGVMAAIILGFSRAVGETMAIILVAGNSVQMVTNPLQSVRTLTATIALEMGYATGRHAAMLFSIGIVLLLIVFILNGIVLALRRRSGEGEE